MARVDAGWRESGFALVTCEICGREVQPESEKQIPPFWEEDISLFGTGLKLRGHQKCLDAVLSKVIGPARSEVSTRDAAREHAGLLHGLQRMKDGKARDEVDLIDKVIAFLQRNAPYVPEDTKADEKEEAMISAFFPQKEATE